MMLVQVVLKKKIFYVFPNISVCKACDPQHGAHFLAPEGHYLNGLVKIKYQQEMSQQRDAPKGIGLA